MQGFFRSKPQRVSTNGDDACWFRNPLGGIVMVILYMLWLRVKTHDLAVSTAATLCVVTLLGASMSLVANFGFFVFSIFNLLYKRFFSLSCIGSTVVTLFIKWNENRFREAGNEYYIFQIIYFILLVFVKKFLVCIVVVGLERWKPPRLHLWWTSALLTS
jgi:hypothetical protein